MESLRLQIQQFKNWLKNYSGYRYFGSKGLILMAKNFYGLKDSFQATYILDNVIENFTDFPDVISEAKKN
jgi:hypothetical protein